jgi:hypothetical protein
MQELLSLLLKFLLLEVWNNHACLLTLVVQELADGSLDLNGCQMLSRHWPAPWLLDNPLQHKTNKILMNLKLTL